MKIKTSFIVAIAMALSFNVFAAKIHYHPKHNEKNSNNTAVTKSSKVMRPGYCEIEIVNYSRERVYVSGTFDDGSPLSPFSVAANPWIPEYVSLDYYGYCHHDMYLHITTYDNYVVYSGYTMPDHTVSIYNTFLGKASAKVVSK